ncbi:hypothetical protein FQA39_LY18268 [Lamprigera yunnana]|nr:hypothetical protein FQA39_LY18268 [Lamprigera yunnana]
MQNKQVRQLQLTDNGKTETEDEIHGCVPKIMIGFENMNQVALMDMARSISVIYETLFEAINLSEGSQMTQRPALVSTTAPSTSTASKKPSIPVVFVQECPNFEYHSQSLDNIMQDQINTRAAKHSREHFETEWDTQLNKHKSKCIKESGVNKDDAIDIEKTLTYPDYPNFKCYLKCQEQSLKLLDTEGNFNEKNVIKIVEGATEEITHKCVQETLNDNDLCKRANDFSKCLVREIFASNGI